MSFNLSGGNKELEPKWRELEEVEKRCFDDSDFGLKE